MEAVTRVLIDSGRQAEINADNEKSRELDRLTVEYRMTMLKWGLHLVDCDEDAVYVNMGSKASDQESCVRVERSLLDSGGWLTRRRVRRRVFLDAARLLGLRY